jgi:chlorophyll/bacteriochlorophyll a synthase
MAEVNRATAPASLPSVAAVIELLKPITWFPPMWAFACGAVSAGQSFDGRWWLLLAGVVLAGPLLCAMSQAVNDWYDRDVDAINQPGRPIPSGRIPGRWGLGIAVAWSAISLLVAAALGAWVFGAALAGLLLAWAYSAPPLRLKRNGWWGNLAVGVSYEGLAWITGAAVMLGGSAPPAPVLVIALLYSVGAHGIMTLNDFKSMPGDRRTGIGSLPVRLGPIRAAWLACGFMIVPQVVVVVLLLEWGQPLHALAVAGLLLIQVALMVRFLQRPVERALWYSAAGVNFFVLGMMVSAFAMRSPAA